MSDETSEAIVGDAIAASLERPARQRRRWFGGKGGEPAEPTPLTHCEDCGEKLHGHYCSACGQVAIDYRRSFRHVIADVAESILNWDSKFTKTMGLLLLKPGWLTNQFISGRRTRYLHPLRLYLLVSIAFFLAARLIPVNPQIERPREMTPEDHAKVEEALKELPRLPPQVRAEVQKAIEAASPSPSPRASSPSPAAAAGAPNESAPASKPAEDKQAFSIFDDGKGPEGPFEEWLQKRAEAKLGKDGTKLQLFASTLRDNISTMMLFCIPLFALVLKIIYLRQRRYYIEHLVYALHIHSFFYLAVLLIVFSAFATERWAPVLHTPLLWILWLALVAQVFLSIRQVYRQSWFMSTFKFFFGGFIYLLVSCNI